VENNPLTLGSCSPLRSYGADHYDSYMIWEGSGHRLWLVNLMDASHSGVWVVGALGDQNDVYAIGTTNTNLDEWQNWWTHQWPK
jgi:hypothetical protein